MAAAAFADLFGKKLVSKMGAKQEEDKTVDTLKALADKKQIGIYFSAHWCPPCRGFTPTLSARYKELKDSGFEVVFASSDRDRGACKEYFEEMGGWLTLPFEDRELKEKLSKKYKVSGIPTLIILDDKAELLSDSGRNFITSKADFPFVPPTIASSLGDKLVKKVDGKVVEVATKDALKGKNVALYFSAHWCPPCRGFTPKLANIYKSMKQQVADGKREDDFEFVFVSSDRDDPSFQEYFAEMPWLALPYSNRKGKSDLSEIFGVRGIPSLVTLDADLKTVINKSARGSASGDADGLEFPWHPKAVNDVNEVTDGLNDEVCVVTLLDGADAADASARKKDIEAVAKKYYDAARKSKTEPPYRFFIEEKKGQISGQIRKLTATGDAARTIILDLGDSGSYYVAKTEGDVEGLLTAFKNKKLEKKQVQQ